MTIMKNIYNDDELRQYDDLIGDVKLAGARRKYKGRVDVDAQWERFSKKHQPSRRISLWASLTAVAAAACVAIAFFFLAGNSEFPDGVDLTRLGDGRMCLSVAHNAVYQHTLSDGSTVEIQSGSSLIYPEEFGGGERLVELAGEAVFDVTSDKTRPFRVVTSNATVKVHGTLFRVVALNAQSHTVQLLEGSVTVYSNLSADSVMMRPGDEVDVRNEGGITLASDVDMVITDGEVVYHDTELRVILADLCRTYDVTLEESDSPMLDLHINFAAPHGVTLQEMIERLNMLDAIRIETDEEVIRIK